MLSLKQSLKDIASKITTYDARAYIADIGSAYIKLSNGLIIQWGQQGSFSSGYQTITLPVTMKDTSYKIFLQPVYVSTYPTWTASSQIISTSAFHIYGRTLANGTISSGFTCNWLVIGNYQ